MECFEPVKAIQIEMDKILRMPVTEKGLELLYPYVFPSPSPLPASISHPQVAAVLFLGSLIDWRCFGLFTRWAAGDVYARPHRCGSDVLSAPLQWFIECRATTRKFTSKESAAD